MSILLAKFFLFFFLLFTTISFILILAHVDHKWTKVGEVCGAIADKLVFLSWFPLVYIFVKYHL